MCDIPIPTKALPMTKDLVTTLHAPRSDVYTGGIVSIFIVNIYEKKIYNFE